MFRPSFVIHFVAHFNPEFCVSPYEINVVRGFFYLGHYFLFSLQRKLGNSFRLHCPFFSRIFNFPRFAAINECREIPSKSLCAYPPFTCVELRSSHLEIVSLTKGRRVNSSTNLKVVCIFYPPPSHCVPPLLKMLPGFWFGKIERKKPKFTFQLVNYLAPGVLSAALALLHCQQGQLTILLGNDALCLSIWDGED